MRDPSTNHVPHDVPASQSRIAISRQFHQHRNRHPCRPILPSEISNVSFLATEENGCTMVCMCVFLVKFDPKFLCNVEILFVLTVNVYFTSYTKFSRDFSSKTKRFCSYKASIAIFLQYPKKKRFCLPALLIKLIFLLLCCRYIAQGHDTAFQPPQTCNFQPNIMDFSLLWSCT